MKHRFSAATPSRPARRRFAEYFALLCVPGRVAAAAPFRPGVGAASGRLAKPRGFAATAPSHSRPGSVYLPDSEALLLVASWREQGLRSRFQTHPARDHYQWHACLAAAAAAAALLGGCLTVVLGPLRAPLMLASLNLNLVFYCGVDRG